jgi:hypothetical protein
MITHPAAAGPAPVSTTPTAARIQGVATNDRDRRMRELTRKAHPLRWAIFAAAVVFVIGAALPIWRGYGSLWQTVWMAAEWFGVLSREMWLEAFWPLPPMLGGLVFLTGLTAVLTYRWVAARRTDGAGER